jgi:hypothetical protein
MSKGAANFKPQRWTQVVYGIPVFAVAPIMSVLKIETAPYTTIVAVGIIALLFYIVRGDNRIAFTNIVSKSTERINEAKTAGCRNCLRLYRNELNSRKKKESDPIKRQQYEQAVSDLGSRIQIYDKQIADAKNKE